MDIENNGEADAAEKTEQALGRDAPGDVRCTDRRTPQGACNTPGTGSSQGDGNGDEKNLNDPVDAGVCVAVDYIPHGVGKEQAGNQNHQCSDGRCIRVGGQSHSAQGVGQKAHGKGCGQCGKKRVGFHLIQDLGSQAHQQACAQGIHPGAPEEQGEACSTQKISQIPDWKGIGSLSPTGLLQPLDRFLGGRGAGAQMAAEIAEPLHTIQVIAVGADAAHPGHRAAVGVQGTDDQIVGNGKHFGIDTVGGKNAADALLHAEGLCTAHGKLIADVCRQVK